MKRAIGETGLGVCRCWRALPSAAERFALVVDETQQRKQNQNEDTHAHRGSKIAAWVLGCVENEKAKAKGVGDAEATDREEAGKLASRHPLNQQGLRHAWRG